MTRQEAVQKLATTGCLSIAHAEDLYDSFFPKPVVPQYVVDWYEEHKDNLKISICQTVLSGGRIASTTDFSTFELWFCEVPNSIQTLVNMHQFGYEVEKEPRYTVRIKGLSEINRYLNKECDKEFLFADSGEFEDYQTKFTRKELEEGGFGEVFDNPMFEVKEVEGE